MSDEAAAALKLPEPTPLELATTDDLIGELAQRFPTLIVYGFAAGVIDPRQNQILLRGSGDVLHLHGALRVHVLPQLEMQARAAVKKPAAAV